ncbi:MAG: RdgB/HAM1 family non-canonical purine NTP pyrophosphatase [Phycisphaerae bacterium]|nr:RdgB/HAM1 family non-canonical purine NTP pyrophosphatase [Phycisphaerae bacterium]
MFATSNPHKLAEVAEILRPTRLPVEGLGPQAARLPEPVEDGATFVANAHIKAAYYARHTGALTLADDSGLVVDALGGEPSVHSARYAGVEGGRDAADPANNRLILDRLVGIPDADRTARFVCVMVLADGRGTWAVARGVIEGLILTTPRGAGGFGYDPLFFSAEANCALAELSREQKNALSHRGRATRRMAGLLDRLLAGQAGSDGSHPTSRPAQAARPAPPDSGGPGTA